MLRPDRSRSPPRTTNRPSASARSAHRPSACTSPARSSTTAPKPTATIRARTRCASSPAFADDDIVFLAGSTQEPEEQIALDIFRRLAPQHPRLRLILVPRHPERFDAVAKLLDASRTCPGSAARSYCDPRSPRPRSRRILLVDTVGELGAWWGTAQIAFVGGSFGSRGGQNMIEPAAYGAAVSFGPNTRNFRDIVAALLAADAAVVVHDATELEAFVRRASTSPPGPAPSASGPNASSAPSSEQPHARSNCSMPCCRRLTLKFWGARPRDFAARGADRRDAPNCPRDSWSESVECCCKNGADDLPVAIPSARWQNMSSTSTTVRTSTNSTIGTGAWKTILLISRGKLAACLRL